ncbi:DgyrCDS14785 [Dimorphilus gyrociliatus]|uniref:DgyrCDS14785 n=1 Tax=Dimorphilus gyrociliatus TaxID=2664684 RepID=A0A7I8WF31_9ANNE|nr:DgyrCDS14785 [Dimorphilus gyrociliatus]
MATMKAMICNGYGDAKDVFELKTIAKPIPKDNEILVKIHATMATSGDCLFKPKNPIWGLCFAGEIEKIGKNVELFKEGDQVFGSPESAFGMYAQYICLPETGCVVEKPKNLSYTESVAILFGTETAIQFLEGAKIGKDQKVLVYGASGSVGIATVQMAKYYGTVVTGVCSTTNLEMVKSNGADYIIDYTKNDFRGNGKKYDIIFDTVGKLSYSSCKDSLNPTGFYLMALFSLTGVLHQLWRYWWS